MKKIVFYSSGLISIALLTMVSIFLFQTLNTQELNRQLILTRNLALLGPILVLILPFFLKMTLSRIDFFYIFGLDPLKSSPDEIEEAARKGLACDGGIGHQAMAEKELLAKRWRS